MTEALDLAILLVEDDDVAAEAVMRGLKRCGVSVPVAWAEDGEAALRVLRGTDPLRHAPRPRVVLLDLNMPRMDGFEFLQQLRADPALCDEVVFVLTTSDADADRVRAYHENVAGYMVKALVGPQFAKLAQLLVSYRLAVRLP
ncbi:response regulator [Ideonella azotifigens]|uniref:Response regulator n=2 Tax=Ideonella azotifigens TaxID=513160 RepID=A0ABP3V0G7_9BURK|nr:response regulator [Ideonella azotifigens]MCD2340957.1 response regulator [Ideonella azotifigens]